MASDPFKFKLGLFVVGGLALGLGGFFAVGAAKLFERTLPLNCYFTESVQGLEEGSELSIRGVRIGRVKRVSMIPAAGDESILTRKTRSVILVECEIDPARLASPDAVFVSVDDFTEQVRRQVAAGLRVTVEWASLTGEKYLELDFWDPKEYSPPSLGFLPMQPYVPTAEQPSFGDIKKGVATTVANLSKVQFKELVAEMRVTLGELREKVAVLDTQRINDDVAAATGTLRERMESPELKRAVERLDTITANLESSTARVDELLAGERITTTLDDLAATAASIRRTAQDLETSLPRLVEQADGAVVDARRAIEEAQVGETAASIRDAADEVALAGRSMAALKFDVLRTLTDLRYASRTVSGLARAIEERPHELLGGKKADGEVGQ